MNRCLFISLIHLLVAFDFSIAEEVATYESFAKQNPGDSATGKKLFESDQLKCHLCHTIGTQQQKGGPDLLGIADKYNRDQLIDHVLRPSKDIVAGYVTETFVLKSGKTVTGIIQNRTKDTVDLWIADGKSTSLPATRICMRPSCGKRFSAMLIVPLITMRLFSEEQKLGTIEPLLTAPVPP